MDNQYKYGVVKDLDGRIVGFNLSPDLFIGFTDEDIFNALERYANKKAEQDRFLSICGEIAKSINDLLKMEEGE